MNNLCFVFVTDDFAPAVSTVRPGVGLRGN